MALRPVQQGSGAAVKCTGADGQPYAFTAVGSHLWSQTVRRLFGSPDAAASVPVRWSAEEAAGAVPNAWLQHTHPLQLTASKVCSAVHTARMAGNAARKPLRCRSDAPQSTLQLPRCGHQLATPPEPH